MGGPEIPGISKGIAGTFCSASVLSFLRCQLPSRSGTLPLSGLGGAGVTQLEVWSTGRPMQNPGTWICLRGRVDNDVWLSRLTKPPALAKPGQVASWVAGIQFFTKRDMSLSTSAAQKLCHPRNTEQRIRTGGRPCIETSRGSCTAIRAPQCRPSGREHLYKSGQRQDGQMETRLPVPMKRRDFSPGTTRCGWTASCSRAAHGAPTPSNCPACLASARLVHVGYVSGRSFLRLQSVVPVIEPHPPMQWGLGSDRRCFLPLCGSRSR